MYNNIKYSLRDELNLHIRIDFLIKKYTNWWKEKKLEIFTTLHIRCIKNITLFSKFSRVFRWWEWAETSAHDWNAWSIISFMYWWYLNSIRINVTHKCVNISNAWIRWNNYQNHSIFDTVKIAREVTISSRKKVSISAGNFLSSQCPGRSLRPRKLVHFRLQPRDSQHFVNGRIITSISSESKFHHPAIHFALKMSRGEKRQWKEIVAELDSRASPSFDEYFITM